MDAPESEKPDTVRCPACAPHFEHLPGPCDWHDGSCEAASADTSLYCPCGRGGFGCEEADSEALRAADAAIAAADEKIRRARLDYPEP
jgi:hypothetical protein